MSALLDRMHGAHARLAGIVDEVCGHCADSCCHQGTMMGLQGLRRLQRGVTVDPGLGVRLRAGLAARLREMQHDLHVAEKVADLLRVATLTPESRQVLPELDRRLADLRQFVAYLESDFPLNVEGMTPLLHYSALRHNLLRCLRQFPGAEAALNTLSRGEGSFAFRGRKIAPPRCIFHHDRCLAEAWKPVKCASFFCTNEPNLLARCRDQLSFDDFVLAAIRPASRAMARQLLELEGHLGADYWEPKVILGPETGAEEFHAEMVALLAATRPSLKVEHACARFMKATNEILEEVLALPGEQVLCYTCQSVDGAALYELAVAMDRARNQGWPGGFVLLAQQLAEKSFMPHPLWEDQMISQPLGGLEVYFCE